MGVQDYPDDNTSSEIVVHVYRELPPVVDTPIGTTPEVVVEIDRLVELWHEGRNLLAPAGYRFVVCDHRDLPGVRP